MTSSDTLPRTFSAITLNLSCNLGAFPSSSLENFTPEQPGYVPNLNSSGFISQECAECFQFFHEKLNPYLHYILPGKDSLAVVRSRSSLLTTAICTTAALCSGSPNYHNYLDAFRREVSSKLFSTHYTFDDIRALCIGAFWLNDISSALNSLAVRIAAELNLHRCITKMPHNKMECYERTRLYFLVYICDHHCSLSHGRPPLTREFYSLKAPRAFLKGGCSTHHDLALISHVELCSITSRVFDTFGADIQSSSVGDKSAELGHLSSAYDRWRQEWIGVLTIRNVPNTFARHMFDLYYHSAKLYLFSHVFRGPAQQDDMESITTNGMDRVAQHAIENALSVIRCISDGNENQVWLVGNLPCYFGTVTAFAAVLLLRASWQAQYLLRVEKENIFKSLQRLTELIRESRIVIHSTHPLLSIANSLEIAIEDRHSSNCDNINGIESDNPIDSLIDFDIFIEDLFGPELLDNNNERLSLSGLIGSESPSFANI
ncbi:hypothetical protein OIDMADRAFT_153565 [Oidiodendron maius Zn]|uniref:Xylanolytic transcriptional activator regulatory domain-containing protein n=1 Tax=Oidiodendron maius (strain Zn) TaxID=913774 RepID=A0A0C3I1I1_OIDMZ|nr:hypothetical protein OIDMADRAFT_153565 [Oidiodendron maius Zn]